MSNIEHRSNRITKTSSFIIRYSVFDIHQWVYMVYLLIIF